MPTIRIAIPYLALALVLLVALRFAGWADGQTTPVGYPPPTQTMNTLFEIKVWAAGNGLGVPIYKRWFLNSWNGYIIEADSEGEFIERANTLRKEMEATDGPANNK